MIISLNWIKKYTDIDCSLDELTALIGSRLVEIEKVTDLGTRYENIVVAKVVSVSKHPNADKLNVVQIDDGGAGAHVQRLENGLVQVVCGAPNVREGITVGWLMPGATVPSSFEESELFTLEARELRGVLSNGMLGSGKELGLNSDHDGIAELDESLSAGASFASAMELDDYLLDIENKSLTHRPDCFGVIGFAREVAAIQGKPFTSPEWIMSLDPRLYDVVKVESIFDPSVSIEDPTLCARYQAVVISGVDSTVRSPLVIQSYLKRIGIKPISAVVDVTNYLMVNTGHPLHAFDYDAVLRVQGTGQHPVMSVRSARDGERLELLDGRTISLVVGDIVVCAGDVPIALAGAMGGAATEVSSTTKNILLESATFNLYNLRTTSMRHGVFTEAVTRFTKGQSSQQTAPVLASAVRMISDVAGGSRATEIIDSYPGNSVRSSIKLSLEDVNELLGTNFSLDTVKQTLTHIECVVEPLSDESISVVAPYWRQDLNIKQDLVEEIGRINGFDSIPVALPTREFVAVRPTVIEQFKQSIRGRLVTMGANEVLTYSFIHGNLIQKARQESADAYRIVNAISPELQYYRLSLMPSLLSRVTPNIRSGYSPFALFEINKVHSKKYIDSSDNELPLERQHVACVVAASDKYSSQEYEGSPYYQASTYVKNLSKVYGIDVVFSPFSEARDFDGQLSAPFEPKRSALITCDGKGIGIVGEFASSVSAGLKLPSWTAGFELLLDEWAELANTENQYRPISKYQGSEQDICFKVDSSIQYGQLESVVQNVLVESGFEWRITPVDIFQKSDAATEKQMTIRILLNNHEASISSEQVQEVVQKVIEASSAQLHSVVV